MVGVTGFEPATSRPPDVRATKLRYTPTFLKKQAAETFDSMAYLANQARNILAVLAMTFNLGLSNAFAANDQTSKLADELAYPPELAQRVAFWEGIFQLYDSQTVLIHDFKNPQFIIDILPFSKMAEAKSDPTLLKSQMQKTVSDRYMKRYQLAMAKFKSVGIEAKNLGSMEMRIYEVYRRDPIALQSLLSGGATLRQQRGLSDIFKHAADKAQDFLPYFENEFRAAGVPEELTRIVFVESMFNEQALSKVGASGMFQFMRGTAKSYMMVNHLIDERNSPVKAARAAALLLKSNYEELRSWALAVTAYNHGRGGMSRAVKTMRSTSLPYIIDRYNGPSFGFASQNFFAEYSAARKSYNKVIRDGTVSQRPSSLKLISGKLLEDIAIHSIEARLKIPLDIIFKFNPCINKRMAMNVPSSKLPRGFELLLPRDYAQKMSNLLVTINDPSRLKRVALDVRNKNRRGE
jgi:membrane-bound lytic murein transglycosylase D